MNKKFSILPTLLISSFGQWVITILRIFLSLDSSRFQKDLFLVTICISGGMISRHLLKKDNRFISGLSPILFFTFFRTSSTQSFIPPIPVMITLMALGILGSVIYDKIFQPSHIIST